MKETSDMFALVMCLLFWTPDEGICCHPLVHISPKSAFELPPGAHFKLSCEFTCLHAQHVAQLWRENGKEKVSLINVTSNHPNVTVDLNVSFVTKAYTGSYCCMTNPPDTISPSVFFKITDTLTKTFTLTTTSAPTCNGTHQHNGARGLQAQIWCWMLLGKTVIFLLIIASLTYRKR
ncbi:uncharacterized protein ACNS7B_019602 [Menidia menidia]